MNGALRGFAEPSRELRDEERELIRFLLECVRPVEELNRVLADSRVRDMKDGGMGSIRFVGPEPLRMGRVLVEALYQDSDGVEVSISVNSDADDDLFELDFWKVDFSSLKRYPRYSELVVKRSV
jgi:hypothetical protein